MTRTPPSTGNDNATELKRVEIYTDGACIGNPGPGGYGVVLLHDSRRSELSGGFRRTTNNRMEIIALIEGLSALKESCEVEFFSDSKYVVRGCNQWLTLWQKRRWKKSNQTPGS